METQKFIVTSKRNDYLHAYHTSYSVWDDNDREIAMKAIERCKPPLLDLKIEEVPNRPGRSTLVYTIELKYPELVDLCYTHEIKMYFDAGFEYPIIEILREQLQFHSI